VGKGLSRVRLSPGGPTRPLRLLDRVVERSPVGRSRDTPSLVFENLSGTTSTFCLCVMVTRCQVAGDGGIRKVVMHPSESATPFAVSALQCETELARDCPTRSPPLKSKGARNRWKRKTRPRVFVDAQPPRSSRRRPSFQESADPCGMAEVSGCGLV